MNDQTFEGVESVNYHKYIKPGAYEQTANDDLNCQPPVHNGKLNPSLQEQYSQCQMHKPAYMSRQSLGRMYDNTHRAVDWHLHRKTHNLDHLYYYMPDLRANTYETKYGVGTPKYYPTHARKQNIMDYPEYDEARDYAKKSSVYFDASKLRY